MNIEQSNAALFTELVSGTDERIHTHFNAHLLPTSHIFTECLDLNKSGAAQ